eukprot:CCRYP_021119-RA/>CCRYP_021119-RA protein AED:0.42 eAED:0.42 QI:0/-1/0/1/-1/1/1/0/341
MASQSLVYDDTESIRVLLSRCGLRPQSSVETIHHVEFEKQRALQDLQRQHDLELSNLFSYLEVELSKAGKAYNHKISLLQNELDGTRAELSTIDRMYHNKVAILHDKLDRSHAVSAKAQDEFRQFEQRSLSDLRAIKNELNSTLQRNSVLENEVATLRRKVKQQQDEMVNKRRQYLGEIESKNKLISSLREEIRTRAQRSDGSILNKTEEIRKLNREAILNTNEEIRRLKSESILSVKKLYSQGTVNTINIDSRKKWDVESELTQEHLDIPPIKQVPFSTRSNIIPSPMHLLGEDISMSYSSENDEDDDHNSIQADTWRENRRKGMNDSLSKKLESMYCKK